MAKRRQSTQFFDLPGKRVHGRVVMTYLRSLGLVEESSPDEEQGPEHYAAVRSAGVEVMAEGGTVQAATVFQGSDWYADYRGPLPLGLSMAMVRSKVRQLLGPPSFQMEATTLQHLGRVGPCDRWDHPKLSTAVDYHEKTKRITRVQVMLPGAVPK